MANEGIFLVEARRLVVIHGRAHGEQGLDFEAMCNLLKESIYGLDTSEDAIKVAAFSCYLAPIGFSRTGGNLGRCAPAKTKRQSTGCSSVTFSKQMLHDKDVGLVHVVLVGHAKKELTDLADNYIRNLTIAGRRSVKVWTRTRILLMEVRPLVVLPVEFVLFNRTVHIRTDFVSSSFQ